ncbi:hypothetical protein N8I77_013400 [Diaporthe amygdali]|uniref:Uncharacterized protein n=1 Tax=Phomopsis amygdali TaxID=1214568 RepID=A0AAD9VYW1_PHOAM|nr:hypothetical protein N8I77_013400 [Diaporthe amygdali]
MDLIFADDQEFCIWPLTHDFDANPFRYRTEVGQGPPLLWHSILALSYKHIHHETGSCLDRAASHKEKALQLFDKLEGDLGSEKTRANLLDGLLILMTLDCATSAQGPWVTHLRRAGKIIQALKEAGLRKTPRVQAQLDMLIWWDVTLGLTTRQGFVLSDTIGGVQQPTSGSSFFNISGCPAELFRYMFLLGTYAHELELTSQMTCVTFDIGPVLAVEKAIKDWQAPQYDDLDADLPQPPSAVDLPEDWGRNPVETAHYVQDLYHSAQAWRFALLVYIERVFKWRDGRASKLRITLFARKALDHTFSCRRSAMMQKQLLLPVFLAACETEDEALRDAARDYCSWWSGKTRYDMFVTTLGLLEEVWTAAEGDMDSWWGSLIDRKSGSDTVNSAKKQFLFG